MWNMQPSTLCPGCLSFQASLSALHSIFTALPVALYCTALHCRVYSLHCTNDCTTLHLQLKVHHNGDVITPLEANRSKSIINHLVHLMETRITMIMLMIMKPDRRPVCPATASARTAEATRRFLERKKLKEGFKICLLQTSYPSVNDQQLLIVSRAYLEGNVIQY